MFLGRFKTTFSICRFLGWAANAITTIWGMMNSNRRREGKSFKSLEGLATPPHALPALDVQLAKQPTASGDFLPPRSEAVADAREGMPLKTLGGEIEKKLE
ncbi:hypothetical protein L3X38_014040 [Prunus dulcis]|uniref:Uncharacterized protein n=1 Tax=Prunus dulcis TaxID=3755 RepID=A0AAD4ZHY4_PRUDU|nr:hypothetical protein L3X38_014040 [Prunus dulcis]